MRRRLNCSLLVLAIVAVSVHSADADQARAVLERAIQAHGGAQKLSRLQTVIRTAKGELAFGGGTSVPAVCETTMMLPDRCRWAFELELNGQKSPLTVAIDGGKGWRSGGGMVKELTKLEAEEPRAEAYVAWLTTLTPLKEAGFQLASLPDLKIGNAPAAGIQVTHKGSPNVKLYFDKQSGLLVKAERKGREAGIDSLKEYFFGEPKEYGGLKLPTRHVEQSNGKKVADWTITRYQFPDQIDAKEFAKP